ncbi:PorP/SprF family type IX secretion system membrane protein [Saccharicrinis fermentans]|uniref:Bacteroidetes-specific putative membrane protein n=1 Tax=Saccharicrinis fermentans DSM 9555 = JCM 21142 TaxID=869213 RepID=W7YGD9_9BACT|nr:PorP/SprF family type IX secretion system membrane protein [Saccharicrinis fermentans]GAF01669.1 bacteroidetes-specific putative membrane protein [Saccharicrinis fermentans DSM 9555 = JCM 21142]
MKQISLTIMILITLTVSATAQKELIMSQYMHNKYSINAAFGGSHETLSAYASYRKKYASFENSPSGGLFTVNSPLKNEKLALGFQFFNDQFISSQNTGFNISYTYRIQLNKETKLGLGISAGMINYKYDWNDVLLVDKVDIEFSHSEQTMAPWIGFGAAIYHDKYYAGLSIPSLLYYDRFGSEESTLEHTKIDYLWTAGYIYKISDHFTLQPSIFVRLNMDDETFADISATTFIMRSVILGASYRTTHQIIGVAGVQISPQFRCTYSYDYNTDPIGSYNGGTHEVALQFNFGFKVNSPDPKFF